MTNALLSAPQNFLTALTVGRDRTISSYLCQLNMTLVPKHHGHRLLASYGGGLRKIPIPVKAVHNVANILVDDELSRPIPYNGGNHVDHYVESLSYSSINIWWDFGRCPPPLNFDASKIGNTLIDTVRRIKSSGAIFFRGYGNYGELFPKMHEETIRIFLESGFQVIKDFGCHVLDENLMMADLLYSAGGCPPPAIHMVVIDSKSSTASAVDQLRELGHEIIGVHPEQDATEAVWRWESGQLSAGYNRGPWKITISAKAEHNSDNIFDESLLDGLFYEPNDANNTAALNVNRFEVPRIPLTFNSDKIVNIWWDVGECPLPPNFDARKIASYLTKALHHINITSPIYLRVYGTIPEMLKDVSRLICEPDFPLMGFQLKDYNYDANFENLMEMDCLLYSGNLEPRGIHMFISDGKEYTKYVSGHLREEGCKVISVNPEHKAADGAWRWEPLLAGGIAGQEGIFPPPD